MPQKMKLHGKVPAAALRVSRGALKQLFTIYKYCTRSPPSGSKYLVHVWLQTCSVSTRVYMYSDKENAIMHTIK